MYRIETKAPAPTPFPIQSLLVAAGVAIGMLCMVGGLVLLAGWLGRMKGDRHAIDSARHDLTGSWHSDTTYNGLPCSVVFTFGPGDAVTSETTLTSNGLPQIPLVEHAQYQRIGDRLTLKTPQACRVDSIHWIDADEFVAEVRSTNNPALQNARFTFFRGR